MAAVTNEIERGNAVIIAGNSLAVDDARLRTQTGQRVCDQREAAGEIVAGAAVEAHPRAGLAGNKAEAVKLDFVQPFAAGRERVGFWLKAGSDEPGRESTLQHNGDS